MLSVRVSIFCGLFLLIPGSYELAEKCRCGLENTQSRVFYGHEVDRHKYPWLTFIRIFDDDGKTYRCGGTLIDSMRVLTAAHCVYDEEKNQKYSTNAVKVYLGLHRTSDTDKISPAVVKDIHIHEGYPEYNGYDMALLILEKPVKFNRKVSPICLMPFDSEDILKNKKLTIAGWGDSHLIQDQSNPKKMVAAVSSIPMEAEVDFYTKKQCKKFYKKASQNIKEEMSTSREICAYNFKTYADACEGDSGGPLMYKNSDDNRWYLAGVIARGDECPSKAETPGIYTNLRTLREQIDGNSAPTDFCYPPQMI